MKSCLIPLLLSFGAIQAADELPIDSSNEDFVIDLDHIYTVSVFEEITYFTAYSLSGDPLWEAPFSSEILSWKVKEGQLFVFSMARNKAAYFLTCVDANAGTLMWERVIRAPTGS